MKCEPDLKFEHDECGNIYFLCKHCGKRMKYHEDRECEKDKQEEKAQ